ncbi:MAG: glutaredoxin domain-containing protein [Candidatus Woesearchaeota archaeon]
MDSTIKQRLIGLLALFLLAMGSINLAAAQNDSTKVYFFWMEGCPHCASEKPFLEELEEKYPHMELKSFEANENVQLFKQVAGAYGTTARSVPATFIGDKHWVGFSEDMEPEIERKVQECIDEGCVSPAEDVIESESPETEKETETEEKETEPDENDTQEIDEIPKNGSESHELCVHVFLDYSCGECEEAKEFLEGLGYNIMFHNANNESELYEKFKETYGLTKAGYPTVFIGDTYLIGIDAIKRNFEELAKECKTKDCPCPAEKIKGITPSMPQRDFKSEVTKELDLPLVGTVDVGSMPLVVMTGLMAFIDGFNPCSLWVLTFLLGIVIYTGSRKKIFLVGMTFLLITAAAYGAFMVGLLNVFSYIGYTFWIKIGVAAIATLFGVVNIKDYFWYKKGISFTIPDKFKPKIFREMRNIMNPDRSTLGMLIATSLMALGIVLVELPCTAGFPMIWTNILSQHEISGIAFAALLGLYLIIYLLIELVIFFTAIISLNAAKFEEKHGKALKLVGGMIMLGLAFALLFMPELMNSIMGTVYIFGAAIGLSILIMLLQPKKKIKKVIK